MKSKRLIPSILFILTITCGAEASTTLPGLESATMVVRDSNGIPHIYADNEHDLFFMQGRAHAEDRLFQMDLLRRSAEGTLAEILGLAAVPTDVETRTIGLGRAAERSLTAHSEEMRNILQAYSDGVNSFLDEAETAGQLPLEYGALNLTSVKRWEPLDSVLVSKALAAATSLIVADDIELTIALGTYQAVGSASGLFDGTLLFFEDLYRSAPFDPASTIPDSMDGFPSATAKSKLLAKIEKLTSMATQKSLEHGKGYIRRIRKLPKTPGMMPFEGGGMGGSNSWVVGGQHTPSGRPLLANDMHLRLESPTVFHEVHLQAPDFEVSGSSLPGVPCVVRGHNRTLAWGITNARLDVTDIFSEIIQPDPTAPSGLATVQNGVAEPIEIIFETFSANIDGAVVDVDTRPVLIVPRRNNGPLITAPEPGPLPGTLSALSVQSVGFGPTRDLEGFCGFNRAQNLDQFKDALLLIDFASQNITYADTEGNIAYFISGELPLREDLQNPVSTITPPFLIRNGYSGNSWLPMADSVPENQATPFEILPFDEMPRVVNPSSGIIVSANNDQVGNTLDNNPLNDLREGGNGLLYLNWGGRNFSIRAARETEMINELLSKGSGKSRRHGKISAGQMKKMQADTELNDAKALMPFILQAYDNALPGDAHPLLASIVADPRLAEAVGRLREWNFTTPTGISEGYDAGSDGNGVDDSVATTIYSVWRGKIVANSIDATLDALGLAEVPRPSRREEVVTALKHLLEHDGVGISGLNFFNVPGVSEPSIRRDIIILKSLTDSLDLLASDEFAPAFANSGNQADYRWGRLHRIVMRHPLGDAEPNFNVPPAFGFRPAPLTGLAGIPVDGGFETVDEAPPLDANNVRVSNSDSFMFDFGPTGRFIARPGHNRVRAQTSLPGGQSAVPGSPFYMNLLEPWLNNESFRMLVSPHAVHWDAVSTRKFLPSGL